VRRAIAAVVASCAAVTTAFVANAATASAHAQRAADAIGPGLVTVDVDIHYSKFSLSTLHVRAGTMVRFLVHNDDPIHHEFIVGDATVQRIHELGTDATHPPIPGEVSILPDDVGETFYVFDRPGRVEFACHLPGHYAYGMHGWIVVDP